MNKTALINRPLDFWLLGGFSIIAWLLMSILQHYKTHPAVALHFNNLPYLFATLSIFINLCTDREFVLDHPSCSYKTGIQFTWMYKCRVSMDSGCGKYSMLRF
jgi:hypothetical protein